MSTKFWIGVVSEEHVHIGVNGEFAQLCHGKAAPLRRMKKGDWIIYYSPKTSYPNGKTLKYFTAIGQIKSGEVYPYEMSPEFIPFRVDVDYIECNAMSFDQIKSKLNFYQTTSNVGLLFRRGHFEVSKEDFLTIAKEMGVSINELDVYI
ncbi:EVE domain-containing protein [Bacillus sp. REN10]|uniref:EVE domain-containing protein n=1 Tax=Bacillus sp. REN10 TaxID=2782541 RepID=UPI00193B8FF4|nr:EVE domain-containing protein [Bacillus sp. REN10]